MKNTLKEPGRPWDIAVSWITTLLVPPALLFIAIRIMFSVAFLNVEYRMPNFPADTYGFTLQQRLEYGSATVRYLYSRADISMLGDLKFDDGSPVFNGRELSHMQDVKPVFLGFLYVGLISALVLVILFLAGFRRPWRAKMLAGLRRGGWVTLGIIAAIGIMAAIDFWTFFEYFHALFFTGDSWLFLYSDTLIRLLPIRLWQDGLALLLLVLAGSALALGLGVRPARKPKVE